ncbi:MAG TPA: molybdopterin-binding protein [Methylosinus sp.]|jgi:molybdenum cofactor synthesis domain-containing protein|uniref:competence/damage-inducible protein A n=1 Tax=Methylosinus sp. TaxID=427 RepID=UPI002F92F4DF
MEREDIITAAVLVIGDEILSGRTQDLNTNYIAKYLGELGIDLREVRVVPDVEEEIVAALNALRGRYSYVFTTGGIGPTHDDITADAVAKAFDAPIGEDERAIAMLLERIAPQDLNAARRRMARIPQGAELIENAISKAPGFMIGNVIVMAGVPIIMQAMLDAAAGRIVKGVRVQVATVDAHGIAEGRYAADLEQIAKEHECVTVGSYPSFSSAGVRNQIVLRSRDGAELEAAAQKVRALIVRLTANGTPL